uniref:Uncharacterized protein n=1 Tax=Anguilla anguilla TaxID=7936 RepID=A0A0E9TYY5_ANGAN
MEAAYILRRLAYRALNKDAKYKNHKRKIKANVQLKHYLVITSYSKHYIRHSQTKGTAIFIKKGLVH